jgi:Holliday junction resolvase RusA-like endonuclease
MMLEFTVLGRTATKGSTRSFISRKTGRIVTMADNKSLGGWTQAAKWAAREAGAVVVKKPAAVAVEMAFEFLVPPSARKRTEHTVKPDIDKLIRAVLDALTGICYEDDAQVISVRATKGYGSYEQCRVTVT